MARTRKKECAAEPMPSTTNVRPFSTLTRSASGALASKCAASAMLLRITTSQGGRLFILAIASIFCLPAADHGIEAGIAGEEFDLAVEAALLVEPGIFGDVITGESERHGRDRDRRLLKRLRPRARCEREHKCYRDQATLLQH